LGEGIVGRSSLGHPTRGTCLSPSRAVATIRPVLTL
jgi:hypothetical protein